MMDFDEEKLRIQNERKKHDLEQREKDDIKFVMDSEQGRRVVWSLLEKGQVFGACFNVDPHITAFNEGKRNLALVLLQRVMTHCPDQYLKMAAEASEQE
ncbi:TPA_asm: hypothetical protein GNC16_004491 [Salmonella enterica subsp. enterica serovar Typhimurium]|uniref:Bbp19-like phage domain-containing protein n=1 Tax=Salmonella typhimurium TaxID=90371 RepID=A0A8E6JP69_SALTM|nr:hypothetical protein [Salmonella enterica]ECK0490650.1 hypothetical protein [Salmonella enterica subsp. enterica serovar Saintpaul]EFR5246723.1 hypothetical protein [Salmonella enterica subsp. enterica serovar Infantis]EAB7141311.1 hypothetical protein [Salmonella enterica subsp. enterica serovar Heidelberg]EAB7745009.1 hypothetical protein [Salmonella enterica subsp. enterica serovar Heidelberg]EBC9745288.1 hypothetical protein [Salmonella enterica subsp. enterica serovar Heidelberg]